MRKLFTYTLCWLMGASYSYSQVKNNYVYNTSMPYGTLDIRTRISSSDYYYLEENKTFSFRESSPGVRTNTYLNMTGWDSSPYNEGHLRRKTGSTDYFVMNYRLLKPQNYNSSYAQGYPMIVHLHGAHERANCLYDNCYHSDWDYTVQQNSPPAPTSATHKLLNNDHNLNVGGKQYLDARNLAGTRLPDDPSMPNRAFPGFVVVPQMMNSWDSLQVEDVVRIVRLLSEQYNVDQDRIYIQGISIGGYGVFEAMKRASWLFAAALPMAGVWDANIFAQNQQDKVAHMPTWIFQGGLDPRPTPAYTENIIAGLEKAGAVVRYSLYSDLNHVVWYRAYGQTDYYTWMLSKRKSDLHPFSGNTVIDWAKSRYPKLMLAEGFLAYQWEKDGTILSHSDNTLTVTSPGKYRARFSRKSTSPSEAQWNPWSQVVTITETGTPAPTVSVSITNPDDGQSFTAPASINVTATASVSDGTLSKVEFYNGSTKLGQDASSPYTFTWSNVQPGNYSLIAKAIDNSGNSATDVVNVTVVTDTPPAVSLTSPAHGDSFTAPATVSFTATASDSDGSIARVEFYNGATKLGQDASSPYTFTWANVPAGSYAVSAKAIDNAGNTATDGVDITVSTDTPPVVSLTSPADGQSFTAPATVSFTATASDSDGSIARVEFYNGTTKLGQDASSPYTFTWSNVSAGNYSLIAKAIDNSGNAATDGVDITVIEDSGGSGEPCASTGSIQAETWTGISGKEISSIPLNSSPSSVTTLNLFETPSNIGDSYGTRVRGFICPPVTGNYTFWIASNDNGELWLSSSDSPANKTRIAFVSGWTNPRQWDKYSSQQSASVRLDAGTRYYIEALLKEGSGTDHLSVGWQLPGGALERPIPGNRLIPFEGSSSTNNPPTVNITSPDDAQSFTAPASISVTATATDSDGSIARVEFYNGTTKLGQDTSSPYTFTWSNVSAGNYSLIAKAIDNSGNTATDGVDITVNEDSGGSGEPCASTGSIQAETWTGISGKDISSIPLNSSPSSVTTLNLFETPSNIGDSYGTRVRGFVCPPVTGNYTFWIASNDNGELWLSTSDSPANKTRIAYVSGWTNPRQWDKYSTQQSAAVRLEAGTRYYIEGLLKEGSGTDHMAVGWQLPGGALERPIPGNRLIPFEGSSSTNNPPTVNITSPDDAQSFTAPASISVTATATDSDGSIARVEFYNGTTKLGQDTSSPYTFTWSNVSAGNYSLIAKAIDNSGNSATDMVSITVNDGGSGESCASTGSIQAETWTGISGKEISSIPVNSTPSSVTTLSSFETPSNIGDSYGTRVRGFICPPVTGNYTFWIASNDNGELWLSSNDSPANKTRIAYVSGWTNARQWDKYSSQQSASVRLVAGTRYYIEGLLKEGSGTDHLAVGWQLPGGALERPIAGNRLIPYSASPSTGSDPGSPTATGTIEVELWTGISGKEISSIPVNTSPDAISEITIFETEKSIGDNYGSRVRGYLHAPTTGNYTFWIASDDRGELWLSTDEHPDNKVKIADVSGWTYSRQWDKFTNQMSAPVPLVGGRRYYIEALLKEASGGDHLAVGWQLPGGAMERPIPGSRLSKFETNVDATAARQVGTSGDEKLYAHISVYPNPIEGRDARLTVSGYEGTTQTIQTQLEIINMTGEIVFTERISCGGSDCSEYLLKINEHLVPGVYLINLKTNGERYTKRLFVK